MKKRITVFLLFAVICLSSLSGLTTSDPNDPIYTYLTIWEHKGYIKNLPPLRPYSTQLILTLLHEVSTKTSGKNAETANDYLKQLSPKLSLSPAVSSSARFAENTYFGEMTVNGKMEAMPAPYLSLSGDFNVNLIKMVGGNGEPAYKRTLKDYLPDWADVDIGGQNFLVRQGINSSVAIGSDSLYFQTGLIRSSFGPFFTDGAVISPTAPQSGHFSFTWRQESFTFTSVLLSLTATNNEGKGRYPEKYLVLHSLNVYPLDWLELEAFETVVYGGRFEPLYLMPFAEYFYLQGVLGFPDNSLLGFSSSIRLPYNLKYNFLLYADDLHFNDMIRFDFDTKYKLSLQTGISWAPETEKVNLLSLDYLLVTPYMYTHAPDTPADAVNYLNYTQLGVNLGPDLEPNSDRLTLVLLTSPLSFLDLELKGRYIRHGNGSVDGSVNVGGGDGTIFDDGFNGGICTFQDTTRFLRQDIIEKTLQIGLTAEVTYPFNNLLFTATTGYTLEYIRNKDLVPGEEWNQYLKIGAGVRY